MSATMFSSDESFKGSLSKIPISPTSPSPIRKSYSLRLKGEKNPASASAAAPSNADKTTPVFAENCGAETRGSFLRRVNSFSDRSSRKILGDFGTNRERNLAKTDRFGNEGPKGANSPRKARTKSLSLSLSNTKINSLHSPNTVGSSPKTPPTSPHVTNRSNHCQDWDDESLLSTTSNLSVTSCDHASVARNGTTFSGRSMRYVFHCNQHSGAVGEDYLTPTQRAHRQVKKLKTLLQEAQKELERKDSDILKLTKEVVELRLYKAALSSPEERSNSSDAITVKENTSEEISPVRDFPDCATIPNHVDLNSSYTDSGHFDDFNASVTSKDSAILEDVSGSPYKSRKEYVDKCVDVAFECCSSTCSEHDKLIMEYEKRFQELIRTHEEESYQLKQKHNDKVEELLQRIGDINNRYWQLVPEMEAARERIKELEQQLEETCKKLEDEENKSKEHYIQQYKQYVDEGKSENMVMDIGRPNPSRVSVPELLQELQITKNELDNIKDLDYASTSNNSPLLSAKEALSLWVLGARKAMYRQLMEAKNKNKIDPEVTLQFLKSAVYYFLTDKENSSGHLRAIQSILGFSPTEISNIEKARLT